MISDLDSNFPYKEMAFNLYGHISTEGDVVHPTRQKHLKLNEFVFCSLTVDIVTRKTFTKRLRQKVLVYLSVY